MAKTKQALDLIPLTPAVFHIMLALAEGEKHGYHIMQEVEKITDGQIKLAPGTLYRSIKNLLEDRLIEEVTDMPQDAEDDERRRYYRLTNFGNRVARLEASRLENLVNIARSRQLLGTS